MQFNIESCWCISRSYWESLRKLSGSSQRSLLLGIKWKVPVSCQTSLHFCLKCWAMRLLLPLLSSYTALRTVHFVQHDKAPFPVFCFCSWADAKILWIHSSTPLSLPSLPPSTPFPLISLWFYKLYDFILIFSMIFWYFPTER